MKKSPLETWEKSPGKLRLTLGGITLTVVVKGKVIALFIREAKKTK